MANQTLLDLLTNTQPPANIQSPALGLADRVGQLGAFSAFFGDQRNKDMAAAARRLTGQDTIPVKDQATAALADLDPRNPADQAKILNILKVQDPAAAVKFAAETRQLNETIAQRNVVADEAAKAGYPHVAEAVRAGTYDSDLTKAVDLYSPVSRSQIKYNERIASIREMEANNTMSSNQARIAEAAATRQLQAERVQLERERLELAKQEFNTSRSRLTAGEQTVMVEAVSDAEESLSNMQVMMNVASAYELNKPTAGARGRTEEGFRAFLGTQGDESLLRTQYRDIRNKFTLANLPPGTASDNDVRLAMEGWPSDFANPDHIASFLRGMAKLAALDAELNNERVRFMQEHGGVAFTDDEGNSQTFVDHRQSLVNDPAWIEDVMMRNGLPLAKEGDDNFMSEEDRAELAELQAAQEGVFSGTSQRQRRRSR